MGIISSGYGIVAAIEWKGLTEGLTTAFEGGVEQALPVAAVILAAFIVFKAIRRFVRA